MLRKYMLKTYNIPGLCTDYLRDALDHKVPIFGIHDHMTDEQKSEILWPFFQGVLEQRIKWYKDDLIIEGPNFLPKYLKEFKDDPNMKIVFLGYSNISKTQKLFQIRNYIMEDDWTTELSDFELENLVDEFSEISKYFKSECRKYDIKYYDSSENFEQTIKEAAAYLISNCP